MPKNASLQEQPLTSDSQKLLHKYLSALVPQVG